MGAPHPDRGAGPPPNEPGHLCVTLSIALHLLPKNHLHKMAQNFDSLSLSHQHAQHYSQWDRWVGILTELRFCSSAHSSYILCKNVKSALGCTEY